LSDVLHATISISLKTKINKLNLLPILDVLIDSDLGLDIELKIIFARNVNFLFIEVIDYLFFFLTRYDE